MKPKGKVLQRSGPRNPFQRLVKTALKSEQLERCRPPDSDDRLIKANLEPSGCR